MLLALDDVALFFKLHMALLFFLNQRLKVIPDPLATPKDVGALAPAIRIKLHTALVTNIPLIESFVTENPAHFSEDELNIVRSWQFMVAGKFYVFRELKNYTVFLSSDEPPMAYGVLALSQPFEELIGPHLPVLTQTVLLPFKGKIIYDGLMNSYRISFGPGIRRSLNENFNAAKLRNGIVTTLPMSDKPIPGKPPKAKPRPKVSPKEETAVVLQIIIDMIDRFCRDHLNEEYAEVCRRLAEKLARKRPSPLVSGKPGTWACGIVRTIGWVNFLDDRSQQPHMKLTAIDKAFGVAESTGQGKSMLIRKLLKIGSMDPDWTLRSQIDQNPMAWMIELNGLRLDARHLPREIQEQAFRQGLIPYLPEAQPTRVAHNDDDSDVE